MLYDFYYNNCYISKIPGKEIIYTPIQIMTDNFFHLFLQLRFYEKIPYLLLQFLFKKS